MRRQSQRPRTAVVRPPLALDAANLVSEYLFPECDHALEQKLVHSTSSQACAAILRDRAFLGSRPLDIRYDGTAARASPPSVHFGIAPASDGVIFPLSMYPVQLGDAEEIKLITLKARDVLPEGCQLFHASTTPTQFGQKFRTVYQSRVVVVPENSPSLAFSRANFLPLDKERNRLLFFDEDQLAFASKIMIDGVPRKHTVVITLFGDIPLQDQTKLDVIDGFKCSYSYGKIACPLPGCAFKCRSMADLKIHYRALHLGVKVFECSECRPARSFSQKPNLMHHIESVHRRERPFRCTFCASGRSFTQKRDLQRHVSVFHPDDALQTPESSPPMAHVRVSELESQNSFDTSKTRNNTSETPSSVATQGPPPLTSQQRLETRYSCPKCSRVFFRLAKLSNHMADAHDVAVGHSPRDIQYLANTARRPFPIARRNFSNVSQLHQIRRNVYPHWSKHFKSCRAASLQERVVPTFSILSAVLVAFRETWHRHVYRFPSR